MFPPPQIVTHDMTKRLVTLVQVIGTIQMILVHDVEFSIWRLEDRIHVVHSLGGVGSWRGDASGWHYVESRMVEERVRVCVGDGGVREDITQVATEIFRCSCEGEDKGYANGFNHRFVECFTYVIVLFCWRMYVCWRMYKKNLSTTYT